MSGGLIRKRLSEREGSPPDTRYDEGCNCVQTSTDGGLTWNENVGADPRVNPAYNMPPNTYDDPQCAAAWGMAAAFKQFVDDGIAGTTAIGIANSVFALILVFIPVGWFFALIWAIAEAVLTIGSAALIAAFTEGRWDEIRCLFYCRLDEDGRLDPTSIDALQSDIYDLGDLTINAMWDLFRGAAGYVGMNNAGVVLANPDGDCTECPCEWCYEWDSPEDMQLDGFGLSAVGGFSQTIATSTGWLLLELQAEYVWNGVAGGSGSGVGFWGDAGGTDTIQVWLPLSSAPNPVTWEGMHSASGLYISGNAVNSSGTFHFGRVKIRAVGSLPDFTHGHVC